MGLPKSSRSRYSKARRIDCVLPLGSKTAHRAAPRPADGLVPAVGRLNEHLLNGLGVAMFRHKGRLIVIKQERQPQREGSKTAGAAGPNPARLQMQSPARCSQVGWPTLGEVNSKKGAGYTHAGPQGSMGDSK